MAKVLCFWLYCCVLICCFVASQSFDIFTFSNHEGEYLAYSAGHWVHKNPMSSHILQNPEFWKSFEHEVLKKKAWKCHFPCDILNENLENDAKLYDNDTIFRNRRKGMIKWFQNDTLWATTILGACKELANGQHGIFIQELQKYRLVSALEDYIDHLHYFYTVASVMEDRGEKVIVFSQKTSYIHDIDKLDPIMLVGYSERFEDNCNTSLWNTCMNRHTHTNPHHQVHCLWHDCCQYGTEKTCDELGNVAVREMVCDKVSRRLQKNLNGTVSDAMWDVEITFYDGLPKDWLNKAVDLMQRMKDWNKLNETIHN